MTDGVRIRNLLLCVLIILYRVSSCIGADDLFVEFVTDEVVMAFPLSLCYEMNSVNELILIKVVAANEHWLHS